ncbi:MAG: YafY family transcriptional regulator [Proteobacteria bacterium]|nr:YafY family transcriptional regulator [Pseudomonadota bacterium]MCP4918422.1 YafY family transcriptional regulator [Pseudomonadota bacterium]
MKKSERLFRLVELLRSRRVVTGAELARELGTSQRTLYRDIQALRDAGVPIQGEAGVGYAMEKGFELPPVHFDDSELSALALGLRIVQTWSDPELQGAARTALSKITAQLPTPLSQAMLDTPLYAPDMFARPPANMVTLRKAIRGKRKLSFHYETREGELTDRIVRPLGLYFWGRTWSLASWCELREDFRSFRPDRMEQLEVLEATFDESIGEFSQAMKERRRSLPH